MIEQFIKSLAPYTRIGSIVGKVSTIGYTGYGVKQIWSNDSHADTSWMRRLSLSGTYLLHMGAMSLATAAMFGATEISPQVATATVGVTSLLKAWAELSNEQYQSALLKNRQQDLQDQLEAAKTDFEKILIILENLKDHEHAIENIEDGLVLMRNALKKLSSKNEGVIRKVYQDLHTNAQAHVKKAKVINDYFTGMDVSLFDIDRAMQNVSVQMMNACEHKNDAELENLGIIKQHCIKYKKQKQTIQKCMAQIERTDPNSLEGNYFKILMNELLTKTNLLIRVEIPCSTQNLADLDINDLSSKSVFKQNIKREIAYLESKLDQERLALIDKQMRLGMLRINTEIDFTEIQETLKSIQDTKDQLSVSALSEKSKKSNVNFTKVTSGLALLLCIIPNGEYARLLQPTMLGAGLLAGGSGLYDFHRKYLLKQRLTLAETRRLKSVINDHGFHVISKIKAPQLREHLFHSLQGGNSGLFAYRQTRTAKQQAKVRIHQSLATRNNFCK